MGKLNILGPNGHTEVAWPSEVEATEGVEVVHPEILDAEAKFELLLQERYVAMKTRDKQGHRLEPAEKITRFDPEAGEITMFRQFMGG